MIFHQYLYILLTRHLKILFEHIGNVISAPSASAWYNKISTDSNDVSYQYNDIIDDKVDNVIVNDDSLDGDTSYKYIGTTFFYYTYLDNNGDVNFASKDRYNAYLNGDTSLGDITKHRSLVKIGVDERAVKELFGTTEISYILSNTLVYGENSFFVAFDTTDEHRVVYSPVEAMIGKPAKSIGVSDSAFTLNGTYNGFQTVNGIKYYQSIELLGDYYLATAIPTTNIYESRNAISLYTLLFSSMFIILASAFYTVSSDIADKDYCNSIRYRDLETNSDTFYITTASGKVSKTKAVAARFSKQTWRKKTPEEKLGTILMIYMSIASFLIVLAILFAIRDKNSDSIFAYIFSGVWEKGLNIFAVSESLMIMIILVTITLLAQICVRSFCGSLGARVETTGNLIVSVLRYGSVIGGVFYCLYLFGFNTGSLLASAGILSIVIGLGAQSLISDIIAGIFIVFEGAFRVGDIVTIGDFRGQVLEIGLRTTKIEDISKNIKIFNNSAISGVLNMTKEASYAAIDVSIEYGEDLERVEKVLLDAFPKIRKKLTTITDGPFYKGVSELAESSVNLKITAQCLEKDRMQLARDLNREIFLLFNKHDINIPFPQVTLSNLEKKDRKEEKHESLNNHNQHNIEE